MGAKVKFMTKAASALTNTVFANLLITYHHSVLGDGQVTYYKTDLSSNCRNHSSFSGMSLVLLANNHH